MCGISGLDLCASQPYPLRCAKTSLGGGLLSGAERLFLGLADESLKRALEGIPRRHTLGLMEIEDLFRKIKAGQVKSLLAETPLPLWFEALDNELAARHEALQRIIERLREEGTELCAAQRHWTGHLTAIRARPAALAALPLFSRSFRNGFAQRPEGSEAVRSRQKRVVYDSGVSLARGFFILMDGWAKLTKSTADGEESVLQLLGKKECALDNP
jgi:hypothetical protein